MPAQNNSVSATEVLLLTFLTSFVLFVMIGFQTVQIVRDRDTLENVLSQQDKPLEEARKIQQQFTALALGTKKLADGGDKGSATIVARMEQLGFKFGDQNQNPTQGGPAPVAPGSADMASPAPQPTPPAPPPVH